MRNPLSLPALLLAVVILATALSAPAAAASDPRITGYDEYVLGQTYDWGDNPPAPLTHVGLTPIADQDFDSYLSEETLTYGGVTLPASLVLLFQDNQLRGTILDIKYGERADSEIAPFFTALAASVEHDYTAVPIVLNSVDHRAAAAAPEPALLELRDSVGAEVLLSWKRGKLVLACSTPELLAVMKTKKAQDDASKASTPTGGI